MGKSTISKFTFITFPFLLKNSKHNKNILEMIFFFFLFSVLIVNMKPFIGVVGTLPTVQQNVNKNIGIKNINEFVGENDDFVSLKKE